MKMVEGEAFLAGARRMDQTALGHLFDAYFPGLYRYVFFRIGDQRTSSAIAGQVFFDLLAVICKRRAPQRNLSGWLYRVAAGRVQAFQEGEALTTVGEPIAGTGESWQQGRLQNIFQRLEPEQQHILALRFSNSLSLDEVAHILGKPVRAVKQMQYEALKALERALQTAL